MEKIGFIGLGIMGRPMALNLRKAGYPMTVFDVRPEPVKELVDAGATPELAEATADLMSEAVVHNLDALVTKDYLDHVLDARFAQQDARIDQRFHEFELRISEQIQEIKGQFRLMQAIQALLLAGVFLPQLRALF